MSWVRRYRSWASALLAAVLLTGMAAGNALYTQRVTPHFDFVAFWSAGRALAQGLSPYDADVMVALQSPVGHTRSFYSPFYYPLWTGVLFVPFGLLPLAWAAAAWLTLNQVMFLAALWSTAVGMRWQPSLPVLGLTVLAGLVFHPTLVALLNGQLAILTLFLLSTAYALIQGKGGDGSGLVAGALLALMMVKPQLALTTAPALLALMVVRRRWAGIAGFSLLVVGMVGASEFASPGWMSAWARERVRQAASGCAVPSVWGIACDLVPGRWVMVAALTCVALLVWLVVLWWRHHQSGQPGPLLAMTVIVGQLVSPFLWVYDQTVLLFAFVVGMACAQWRPRSAVWRAILCGWAIVLPFLLYGWANARSLATGNVLLPLTLAGVLLGLSWGSLFPPKRERQAARMEQE